MRLNKKKCIYINMNVKNRIRFKDGTAMPNEDEADYLGAKITKKNLNKKEVDARVCKALATCNKLKLFLKKAKCNKIWKLQVYNAVIVSQLVYGLETMYLNESLLKRLDAFQMTGIRHILGIEHAYWSRTSNLEILEKANWILNGSEDITKRWKNFMFPKKERRIQLISEVLKFKKIKLLGHVIRSEEEDPLFQATFTTEGKYNVYEHRRVGRPRGHWAEEAMAYTLDHLEGVIFERENDSHVTYLFSEALNRRY